MGASLARSATPIQVLVRVNRGVATRTLDAVLGAVRREDRVVIVGADAARPALTTSAARRATVVDGEHAVGALVVEHARSTGGVTIVVDDGAFGFGNRWLTDLASAGAGLGAWVPVSNGVPWPLCPLDGPDSDATRSAQRDIARREADRHGLSTDVVDALRGPCIVIAPQVAGALANHVDATGAPIADQLNDAITSAGDDVGVARGIYVHDERTKVLLSACMIVKDEIDNLERCLASLAGIADEVVIYDTGSTDGSVELARSLGAVVIEGYWDDDFSRARNASRQHCRGDWLLHIDADEEIDDRRVAPAMRSMLASADVDLIAINLFNMEGTELAPVRDPNARIIPRLMRRTRCMWNGALHEHPVLVGATTSMPRGIHTNEIAILHHGYLSEVIERKGKLARNQRIASTRLGELDDAGRLHFERARTLSSNDDVSGAIDEYALAVETAVNPVHRRCSLELGTQLLIAAGRYDEADQWIERRAAIDVVPGVTRWLEACLALAERRNDDVLTALDGITDFQDRYSTTGLDAIHNTRATALARLDRFEEAGVELLGAFTANISYDAAWFALLQLADRLPAVVRAVATMVPESQLKLLAGKLVSAPPIPADPIIEALIEVHPTSVALLAIAARVAPHLELERAATWAIRLRAAGLVDHCPLRSIAANENASTVRRLQAAHLGAELFGDTELRAAVAELSALLPTS